MSVLAYVTASVVWGLAGLVVGYLLGRAPRPSGVLVVTAPYAAVPAEPAAPPPRRFPASWLTFDRVLGVLVIVLAVLSVAYGAVQSTRAREIAECQAGFNERTIAALEDRTLAAGVEREAQRQLLSGMTNPAATREDRAAIVQRYYEALDAADAQRQAHPLPDRPDCREEGL